MLALLLLSVLVLLLHSLCAFCFQIETKMKKLSSRRKKSPSKGKVADDSSVGAQPAGESSLPTQAMWVMTPAGFVQMAQPQALTVLKGPPCLPSPGRSSGSPLPPTAQSAGLKAAFVSAHLSPVKPIQHSPSPPLLLNQNSPSLLQSTPPHKGVINAQSGLASPLRSKGVSFDPSLIFQEPHENIQDWLSGRGGVPAGRVALPYLPPFVSSLNMMAALLRAKKSLTQSSLELVHERPKPRQPPAQSRPDPVGRSTRPPLFMSDSTSDWNGASYHLEHGAAGLSAGASLKVTKRDCKCSGMFLVSVQLPPTSSRERKRSWRRSSWRGSSLRRSR